MQPRPIRRRAAAPGLLTPFQGEPYIRIQYNSSRRVACGALRRFGQTQFMRNITL